MLVKSVLGPLRPDVDIPARTIIVGLGPIGLSIVRAAKTHDLLNVVGAVDPAPGRAGKDLDRVLGETRPSGVIIKSELENCLRATRPTLAFLATSSRMDEVEEDIFTLINHGCSVISTCEELSNPLVHNAKVSERINDAAKRKGVIVVSAGVNPGFVLDRLVLVLCQATRDITKVECVRVVDASNRRPQLLSKMGAGMSPTVFAELALQAGVGHVGLKDSMHLVARGLGWKLDDYRESIVPQVARETLHTPIGTLERGQIRGATQRARGYVDGNERITFHLEIAAGSPNPRDEITVHGTPPVHIIIPGGCSGDEATVSATLSSVSFALFGRPGLRLPTEMPPDPRALAGLTPQENPTLNMRRGPRKPKPAAARKPAAKKAKPAAAKKARPAARKTRRAR